MESVLVFVLLAILCDQGNISSSRSVSPDYPVALLPPFYFCHFFLRASCSVSSSTPIVRLSHVPVHPLPAPLTHLPHLLSSTHTPLTHLPPFLSSTSPLTPLRHLLSSTSPLTHLPTLLSPSLLLHHLSLFASSIYSLTLFPANFCFSLSYPFLIFFSPFNLFFLCFYFRVIKCVYLLSVFN